jgi:hypothetical protein
VAHASYPMIKLWEDAQLLLGNEMFSDQSFVVRGDLNKYGIFFHNRFDTQQYPIEKIFVLKKSAAEKDIVIRSLEGTNGFATLYTQLYRPLLMQQVELKKTAFNTLLRLLQQVTPLEVTRPVSSKPESVFAVLQKSL